MTWIYKQDPVYRTPLGRLVSKERRTSDIATTQRRRANVRACMQRLTARARFNEGLPSELAQQMIQQFCEEHPERHLLAFVYGYLGEQDLLRVRTDAEKYLVMAALNLPECIGGVGAKTSA